ncbi:MAG: hypothetical protein LWX56_10140 [Ignavibacteria bacterium]|nr:hypothetical protein [Ignavibacteria bacterium]
MNMKTLVTILLLCAAIAGCTLARDYESGKTYYGRHNFIEYWPGTLPIVISVPHDGKLKPDEIPNRHASTRADVFTQDIALKVREYFYEKFHQYPHIIINQLHRSRLDANRNVEEAAAGNDLAKEAWEDYHHFIEYASSVVANEYGKGLYIDLHGHHHDIQQLELGYLLAPEELQLPDSLLNTDYFIEKSSIRHMVRNTVEPLTFMEIVRGKKSLGAMFVQHGYQAVPSPDFETPPTEDLYFPGGYDTYRHGSSGSGVIDGIQIETNIKGLRDNAGNIARFAKTMTDVVTEYLQTYYFTNKELKRLP